MLGSLTPKLRPSGSGVLASLEAGRPPGRHQQARAKMTNVRPGMANWTGLIQSKLLKGYLKRWNIRLQEFHGWRLLKWSSVLILINWYQTNGLCSIEIKKMSRSEIEMKNDIEARYKDCTSVRSKDPRTRFHGLPVCTSSDQSDREEETARRRVTLHSIGVEGSTHTMCLFLTLSLLKNPAVRLLLPHLCFGCCFSCCLSCCPAFQPGWGFPPARLSPGLNYLASKQFVSAGGQGANWKTCTSASIYD